MSLTPPARVTYRVLLSDGNYSHIEIGVDLPVEPNETLEVTMDRARHQVRRLVRADYRKMGSLRGWESDEPDPEDAPA